MLKATRKWQNPSIAPYRLGLTATPDEEEYRLELVKDILGDIVYEKEIKLPKKTIYVELTPNEKMDDEHSKKEVF